VVAGTQVESLVSQSQNQEKEIQHSAQQLQNAISVATEEAAKARAAKEVRLSHILCQIHEGCK
jgi:septal ring factor EnvC (AmiA/AmiB activator)